MITLGVLIWIGLGPEYVTELFRIGPVALIGLPFSYVTFGIFGILLWSRFKWQSILMLIFSYAAWEIVPQIVQSITAPNTGAGNPFYLVVWAIIVAFSLYIVKPRVDFTHWASILLFVYYAEIPGLQNYLFAISPHLVYLVELLEEIVWLTMVWKSFYPEHSARGKPLRELLWTSRKSRAEMPPETTRKIS